MLSYLILSYLRSVGPRYQSSDESFDLSCHTGAVLDLYQIQTLAFVNSGIGSH